MRWLSADTIRHLQRLAEWPDLSETKYVIREELGRGGMGTVYLAEDTTLGRAVALKVAPAGDSHFEAAHRMRREARIIAGLEHPSIVPVHDVGTLPDGRVYYAMKRVEGARLDDLAPTLSLAERLRIFQRICEAIAFAHAHDVIHRDLKPANIMVGPFGEVLVMDWGVAKIIDALPATAADRSSAKADALPDATADGSVVGTLSYMSPEQAQGRVHETSRASDVYALGSLLYFLLTSRPPFDGDAAVSRTRENATASPPPVRELAPNTPSPLEAVVEKAMAIAPAARYATAQDLAQEVARFLDHERVLAHREGPLQRAGRILVRYRTPILLIFSYLLMRAALIFFRRP